VEYMGGADNVRAVFLCPAIDEMISRHTHVAGRQHFNQAAKYWLFCVLPQLRFVKAFRPGPATATHPDWTQN
jgi:hypothetical protein